MGDVKAFVTKWCAGHDSGTLGPKIRADLESILAAERAAATAAAVGACAEVADRRREAWRSAKEFEKTTDAFLRGNDAGYATALARMAEAEGVRDEMIRALSPEGWVGVRREDAELAVSGLLLMSARWEFCEEEPLPIAAKAAEDAADRIRAALDAAKDG